MSTLRRSSGEDFPEAAAKHLDDARLLLDQGRFDAAAYLVGYVIECALKTVIMVGELARLGQISPAQVSRDLGPGSAILRRFGGRAHEAARTSGRGHDLDAMVDATAELARLPDVVTAPYMPAIDKKRPPFGGKWTEKIRYRAAGSVSESDARAWFDEATRIYLATVGRMIKDRVIQ